MAIHPAPKPATKRRRRGRPNLDPFLVAEVDRRDGGRCVRCAKPRDDLHHVCPVGIGGSRRRHRDYVSNVVSVCRRCHDLAHRLPDVSVWFQSWAIDRYGPRYYLAEQHRAEGCGDAEG